MEISPPGGYVISGRPTLLAGGGTPIAFHVCAPSPACPPPLGGSLPELSLFVPSQCQVEPEDRVAVDLLECGAILGDGFVETAQRDEGDAQVRARRGHLRMKSNEFLILAHSKRRIPALLGRVRILEELLRIRSLRKGDEGEGQDG